MSYEPQPHTKVWKLLNAMREAHDDERIWTLDEAARIMDVPRSNVPAYIASACNHRLMHRRSVQGGLELRIKAFEPPKGATYEPYVPTKVTVPRPGSDVRVEKPRPPTLCTGCSKEACWDHGCQDEARKNASNVDRVIPIASPSPAPTPAPTPAPMPAPRVPTLSGWLKNHAGELPQEPLRGESPPGAEAPIIIPLKEAEAGDLVDAEVEEEVVPDAFISCRTGEIVLVGLEPDPEGRVTIPADLVELIAARQAARSTTS